jgi:hypothetical protein
MSEGVLSAARARVGAKRGALDRRDAWVLLALLVVAVVVPVAVGAWAGILDIPRNDDWSYREIAGTLYRTGRLGLDNAAETALVGQLFLVQPFLWLSGGQAWAFWVAGATFDAVAVISGYLLARRLLPRPHATLAVALLVLFPGYLAYATSFMTDVPTIAAEFVCLGLGMVAVERRPVSSRWLVAALVAGCVAFSIRQFALAAPAAVMLAALLAEPRRLRHWLILSAVVAVCIVFARWRSSLTGQLGDVSAQPGASGRILTSVATVSLVLLPAAIVARSLWRRHWRRIDLLIGLEVGALIAATLVVMTVVAQIVSAILLEDLISQWGSPSRFYLTGGRPVLLADPLWAAVNLLALVAIVFVLGTGGAILGTHVRRGLAAARTLPARLGSPAGLLALFVAATVAGLVAFGLRWSIYDRYLWVLIPPMATLLMYLPEDLAGTEPERSIGPPAAAAERRVKATTAAAALAVAGLAGLALLFAANSFAFDGARWRAGEALVREGVPADSIDAGYEWLGSYAPGLPRFGDRPTVGGLTWYGGLWPEFRRCALVSSTLLDLPDMQLDGTIDDAYRLVLIAGEAEPLYLYRSTEKPCPGG